MTTQIIILVFVLSIIYALFIYKLIKANQLKNPF